MSNTGYRWIYKCDIPKLKEPTRYKVRIYYKGQYIDVGMFKTIEDAIKRRNQFIKDFKVKLKNRPYGKVFYD